MTIQTVQINIPAILLQRARVSMLDDARELITFLLENYAQELERNQRQQAYEAYYTTRSPQEAAEELELLQEFAFADAEINDQVLL